MQLWITQKLLVPLHGYSKLIVATLLGLKHERYLVARPNKSEHVKTYNFENVPDFIKRGVGMLKLTEDNSIIGDIGYKHKRDEYFIVDPTEVVK